MISVGFIDEYAEWEEACKNSQHLNWTSEWIETKGLFNDKPIEAFRWRNKTLEIKCADGSIIVWENADTHTIPEHMSLTKKSFDIEAKFEYYL